MRDWFESLEARERQFLVVGAVFVVFAILYAGIWAPLDSRQASLREDVDVWQRSLAELKRIGPQVQSGDSLNSRPVAGGQQTPLIIVDQTLRSRSLDQYRTRSQPVSSNGIRVEFNSVAFDDLLLWLGELSNQYGLHVQAGTFSGGSRIATGRVNAMITLERSP